MQIKGTACGMLLLSLLSHVDAVSGMVWLRGLDQTTASSGHMFQPRGCPHLQINIHSSNMTVNSNL
jgi:hypothetical protein